MSFAWPWCFLALPLPWLARRLLRPVVPGGALRLPSLPAGGNAEAAIPSGPALWLAVAAWFLLVIAATRPVAPMEVASPAATGRSLMLAFDVSASMATADLRLAGQPAERLQAARSFADDFLPRHEGDRVGLIVFGSRAYLHTPLTFDLEAVREALAGAEIGLAGRETALGDAIALAVKHLRELPDKERVLVVLTDGANTAGTLAPQRAAWLARREGVRIHTIGIGAIQPGADLDEETLKRIAEQTGGTYLRATDSRALAEFWRRLADVEPAARSKTGAWPQRELYPLPLALALFLVAWLVMRRTREAGA